MKKEKRPSRCVNFHGIHFEIKINESSENHTPPLFYETNPFNYIFLRDAIFISTLEIIGLTVKRKGKRPVIHVEFANAENVNLDILLYIDTLLL